MLSGVWLSTRLDTRARQRLSSTDRHCSSFTLILNVCRARNVPKSSYSRLYHAGVFVLVVAQQIQDMSAVSLTHKAVGVYLSRLRCGAGLVWPGPTDHPNTCHLLSPLLYITCTWRLGGCGIAEFSSLSKRSEGVPPGLNKVNDDNFVYASVSNHRTKQPTGLLVLCKSAPAKLFIEWPLRYGFAIFTTT